MGNQFHDFVASTRFADLPPEVARMAGRCLLDLIGTAAAGTQTDLSRIINAHAARFFGPGVGERPARILFDGRAASPVGAALAGGMTIDSFDSHDGHVLTKGHAGCAILPALAALADTLGRPTSGAEFLVSLTIGYEVAIRAGIAQHRICCDYHTSGAWNALGVAAVAGRLWGLDARHLREAVGIAEYHGPRSQMMRCIDFPTMVKDDAEKSAKALARVEQEYKLFGLDFDGFNPENPVLGFNGKLVHVRLYSKERESRKAPTPEQKSKNQPGDLIKNPITNKAVVSYEPTIAEVYGLAAESGAL